MNPDPSGDLYMCRLLYDHDMLVNIMDFERFVYLTVGVNLLYALIEFRKSHTLWSSEW